MLESIYVSVHADTFYIVLGGVDDGGVIRGGVLHEVYLKDYAHRSYVVLRNREFRGAPSTLSSADVLMLLTYLATINSGSYCKSLQKALSSSYLC